MEGTLRSVLYFASMSVRKLQRTDGAIFFCTYTCWNWLPLIETTALYNAVYKWMWITHRKGHLILGHVIMPNHVHVMLFVREGHSVNALLSNAKRFLTYEMIGRLQRAGNNAMLDILKNAVRPSDRARGQKHRGFTTSSDIRECLDEAMIQQKLEYMHGNPVKGKWSLVEDAIDYPHSSMAFYFRGTKGAAPTTHYHDAIFA